LLGSSGVLVGLSTVIPLNNAEDSNNATGYYNKLIVKLTAAVHSGNFTKLLQQVSAKLGATSLKNATISTITSTLVDIQYPPTSNPTSKPTSSSPTKKPSSSSSSSSKKLSGGAVAGIVIGAVAVLILLIALVYFVFVTGGSSSKVSTGPVQGVQIVNSNTAAV
jgi:hypothetical protein